MHESMNYEEHREALIKPVPSHFGEHAEQWRLILKQKDKWWEDPDIFTSGRVEKKGIERRNYYVYTRFVQIGWSGCRGDGWK